MDEDDVKLVVLCNVAMEDGASGDEDRDAEGVTLLHGCAPGGATS
jgi:hypothetical protein